MVISDIVWYVALQTLLKDQRLTITGLVVSTAIRFAAETQYQSHLYLHQLLISMSKSGVICNHAKQHLKLPVSFPSAASSFCTG